MATSNPGSISVPRQYAGQWIAWNHELTTIIASGSSPIEVRDAARALGEAQPILAKSPPADVRLVGVRSR